MEYLRKYLYPFKTKNNNTPVVIYEKGYGMKEIKYIIMLSNEKDRNRRMLTLNK